MNLAINKLIEQNKEVKKITAENPLVEDLIPQTVVVDPDNSEVGLAVVTVLKQNFGKWQFEINGETRHEINLTSGMVLLLKPQDCISFRPNKGSFWSKATSIDSTFIRVKAWDCSHQKTSGYCALNSIVMETQTSFSLLF